MEGAQTCRSTTLTEGRIKIKGKFFWILSNIGRIGKVAIKREKCPFPDLNRDPEGLDFKSNVSTISPNGQKLYFLDPTGIEPVPFRYERNILPLNYRSAINKQGKGASNPQSLVLETNILPFKLFPFS